MVCKRDEILYRLSPSYMAMGMHADKRLWHRICISAVSTGAEQENGFAVLENLRSPRLLASHLPHNLILRDDSESPGCAKYIYVARNPKDVVVSYYHHVKGFPEEESGFRGPFEFFTRLFLQGKRKEPSATYRAWYHTWMKRALSGAYRFQSDLQRFQTLRYIPSGRNGKVAMETSFRGRGYTAYSFEK